MFGCIQRAVSAVQLAATSRVLAATSPIASASVSITLYMYYTLVYIIIDRVAGEIIRLVVSVYVSVRLSVGALLFELLDL